MSQFHNVHAWGDEEKELQQVQQKFVNYFKEGSKVLDIGSGRGVFLEMLKNGGINAFGIEMDPKMVKVSKSKGLVVHNSDANKYLSNTKEKFDGIFASHIIEHLDIEKGKEFIELIKSHLKKEGIAIIVTPRPGSLWATENFWLDTTHVRPYPLELMKILLRPLEIIDGGIEPDSYALKDASPPARLIASIRRRVLGKELFDFVYGGGVWYVVAKKL